MWRLLAILSLLGACADRAFTRDDYDDVARIVGAHLATPDRGGELGALADTVAISRGVMPKGFTYDTSGLITGHHGGLEYRYFVTCSDAADRPTMCGTASASALAVASWSGTLVMPDLTTTLRRQTTWHLADLASSMGSAAGNSSLMDQRAELDGRSYAITDDQDMLLFVDMASHDMMAGSLRANLAVTIDPGEPWEARRDLTAEVTFAATHTATLVLDDEVYDVDLGTGAVTRR